MNDLFKFGTDVKSRASLYCIGILFLFCMTNLFLGIESLSIYFVLETMIICVVISLIEYFLFLHYDELSKSKRNVRTFIWAVSINVIVITSAVCFHWFEHFPKWLIISLAILMEIALIFFRYSVYIKNLYDTKELNEKLKKYQMKK